MIKNIINLFRGTTLKMYLLDFYRVHRILIDHSGGGIVMDYDDKVVIEFKDYTVHRSGRITVIYKSNTAGLTYTNFFESEFDFKKWVFYRLYVDTYMRDSHGNNYCPHYGLEGLYEIVHKFHHEKKYKSRLLKKNYRSI